MTEGKKIAHRFFHREFDGKREKSLAEQIDALLCEKVQECETKMKEFINEMLNCNNQSGASSMLQAIEIVRSVMEESDDPI